MKKTTSWADTEVTREEARQGARLSAGFADAGYQPVTVPVLQPAGFFLERSGEDIRRRTFIFTDPGGKELCLRPELTIPVCRFYLERVPGRTPARFCYDGPVYRFQPEGSSKPNEYNQAGAENFGCQDADAADAEILALAGQVAASAGVKSYQIVLGDLALFEALMDAIDIPENLRARLKCLFRRPARFREQLARLAQPAGQAFSSARQGGLLRAIEGLEEEKAEAVVQNVLNLAGISPVGGRSVKDITSRLMEQAADMSGAGVSRECVQLITDFLATSGPPARVAKELRQLTRAAGISIEPAIERLEKRTKLCKENGFDLSGARFETSFGRNMEYYTGLVFEFRVPALGEDSVIAGGGRYDLLLQTLGAAEPIPAVGCAMITHRLRLAADRGAA